MTLAIKMTLNSTAVRKSVAGKRKKITPSMKRALNEVGEATIKIAKQNVTVRSGALQRSLDFVVNVIRGLPTLVLGSGLTGGERIKYARIQEEGGRTGRNYSTTIKPQWYMRNAIRTIRSRAKSIMKRNLRKGMK